MNIYRIAISCFLLASFSAGYWTNSALNPTVNKQITPVVSDIESNRLERQTVLLQQRPNQKDQCIEQLKASNQKLEDIENSLSENTHANTANLDLLTDKPKKGLSNTLTSVDIDVNTVKTRFQQESKDWEFSAAQETNLLQQFSHSELLRYVSLQSVECKTSLCKLTIYTNQGNGIGDLYNTIPAGLSLDNLPLHQQGYIILPDEETDTAIVYLNRGDKSMEELMKMELAESIPEV